MTTAPVDERERRRVRDDHGASLFIEAGAGTGKTTALVDRVVALVASGDAVLREVAAITFTEVAAAELRDRIRNRLETAADGGVEWVHGGEARARCQRALEDLDDAALTTLHGFAQRLLAEYPLEAGLPPVFEILDDIRARVRFEQRWSELVERLFDDPALEEHLLTGLVLGLRFDHLRDVARMLHDNHDRVTAPDPFGPLPALDVSDLVRALDAVVVRRAECTAADDLLAQHVDQVIVPLLAWLGAAHDRIDVLEGLNEHRSLRCKNGQRGNWGGCIDEVKDACTAAEAARAGVLDRQRSAVLDALIHHVVDFVRGDTAQRRREGTLEFHDLLVFARDLLREHPEVRIAAARRWPRILLDEFQDTDPLQVELAVLLATPVEPSDTAWRDLPVADGRIVVVGDPKQSIYRFRRADLRVYADAQDRLGFDQVTLVENFRSVPDIIAFVNEVFSELFSDGVTGVQAKQVELHAHRTPAGDHDAVAVFGDVENRPVAEIREDEAADVASIVQQVKRGEWLVGEHGETRPANYADVAILIPSRTVLPGIEDALERANIPARVESQSLLYATAEVRDLLSILTAIDDPTDDIAVVAALRSPAFGCSDSALAEHAAAGGRWDCRAAGRGEVPAGLTADHPVTTGLRRLHTFWDERWWRSVSATVEAVVRECHLLELAVARPRPRDHWRRIRFFLDQARAWDDAGESTLRGFVEWAQQQADERARVSEAVAPEPDDDAVRILTVHGSKGLEFPVVVLAGLSVAPPNLSPAVVWDDTGRAQYKIGTKSSGSLVSSPGYDAASRAEAAHEAAERLRLLYVAMTRARDHLVVSLHRKERAPCHAAEIASVIAGVDVPVLEPSPPLGRRVTTTGPEPPPEPETFDAWVTQHGRALERAARPMAVAATTLAEASRHGNGRDPGVSKDLPPDGVPPWRRGRAGTAVGRAVHAVLQTIDLRTGEHLESLARAQALAEGVADRADEIATLVTAALAAPVVGDAIEHGHRWWREVPVAAEVDGLVLEGFIDLLIETELGLVVVDYKTDQVPDAAIDDAVARYGAQGATYALALESALRRPVARCVFVFARASGAIERELPDLDAAKGDVRAQVAALSR
jgi:ATP-dependent helicase/nuclease subunit A